MRLIGTCSGGVLAHCYPCSSVSFGVVGLLTVGVMKVQSAMPMDPEVRFKGQHCIGAVYFLY